MEEVQGEEVTSVEGEEVVQEVEEVGLPSDEVEFEVPDKFKGKSQEDIIKSYLELEKMQGKGGDEVSQEETGEPEKEDPKETSGELSTEEYQGFEQSYRENGGLTEEDYQALEAKGLSRETVDEEISYLQYREDQAINKVIGPLGGGKEKLQEVTAWAQKAKTPEEIQVFNDALAKAPVVAQQAMLKGLYAEFDSTGQGETVIHSGASPARASKGYATEADFMADLDHPAYKTDKSYVKKVEAKLAQSNTDEWSF